MVRYVKPASNGAEVAGMTQDQPDPAVEVSRKAGYADGRTSILRSLGLLRDEARSAGDETRARVLDDVLHRLDPASPLGEPAGVAVEPDCEICGLSAAYHAQHDCGHTYRSSTLD